MELANTIASWITALATVVGAVIVFIFYQQLVQNDNARERRANEELIKTRFKNILQPGMNSPGTLQLAGDTIARRYPQHRQLLLDAYEELCEEVGPSHISVSTAPARFLELLKGTDSNGKVWGDFKER